MSFILVISQNNHCFGTLRELPHRLHFECSDALLGDEMPSEPRLSAFSFCKGVVGSEAILQPKFSTAEWGFYQEILSEKFVDEANSVGHVFGTAFIAMLGLMDKDTYKGEAALLVETMAASYFTRHGSFFSECYLKNADITCTIPTQNSQKAS